MSQKLSKQIYLNNHDQVVDRSEATCWFADILDENGCPIHFCEEVAQCDRRILHSRRTNHLAKCISWPIHSPE